MTPDDQDWGDDGILNLYVGQFAARSDLYVENGAEVKRQPLTPDVVRSAVRHHYAISAYLATPDGRTHVGAIDFDTERGMGEAFDTQRLLLEHDIPSLVVGSRRGAHLWVTCWDYGPVGIMRKALRGAVALATGSEDPKREVFPKRGEGLAAGALRLPGMPHQRDQQVYPLYLRDDMAYPTFRAVIDAVILTTSEAIRKLAGTATVVPEYPKSLGPFYGYNPRRATNGEDAPSATEMLSHWGVQIRPGGSGRCPMHDDRRASLTVLKDDKRIYCGAPGCPFNGDGHGVGSIQLRGMIQ